MRTNTRRRSIAVSVLVLLALTQLLVLPAAAKTPATDSFDRVWARTDQPVADGAVARTWIWGPAPIAPPRDEDYTEAPTGRRTVE